MFDYQFLKFSYADNHSNRNLIILLIRFVPLSPLYNDANSTAQC